MYSPTTSARRSAYDLMKFHPKRKFIAFLGIFSIIVSVGLAFLSFHSLGFKTTIPALIFFGIFVFFRFFGILGDGDGSGIVLLREIRESSESIALLPVNKSSICIGRRVAADRLSESSFGWRRERWCVGLGRRQTADSLDGWSRVSLALLVCALDLVRLVELGGLWKS